MNSKGEIIFENKNSNDFELNFSEGLAFTGGGGNGLYYIDIKGSIILDLHITVISNFFCEELCNVNDENFYFGDFHEGFAIIKYKSFRNVCGFINKIGNIIIECKYEDVLPFSEGFAAVKYNGLWGYIDVNGNQIIQNKYDKAFSFSEGVALVNGNDNWTFINSAGTIIHSLKNYSEVEPFNCGLAKVKSKLLGCIDKSGKEVIDTKYSKLEIIHNNIIQAKLNYWGVISNNEEIILPFEYDSIKFLDNNVILVGKKIQLRYSQNFVYGLFNIEGDELLEVCFESISLLDTDTLYLTKQIIKIKKDDEGEDLPSINRIYFLYNTSKKTLIETKYKDIKHYSNGLAKVKTEGLYGYIDKNGIEVIPFKYDYATTFYGGFAFVSNRTVWESGDSYDVEVDDGYYVRCSNEKSFKLLSIINIKGEILVDSKFIEATNFKNGKSEVIISNHNISQIIGSRGEVNTKGKWLYSQRNSITKKKSINFLYKYDNVESYAEGLIAVCLNEKWGFLNIIGDEVIQIKYGEVRDFSDDISCVKDSKTQLWSIIDRNGNQITPFIYSKIGKFENGKALAVLKSTKLIGCIDKSGKEIIPFNYDNIILKSIFDELYCVKYEGKWGFIDKKSKIKIPFLYDSIGSTNKEGLLLVSTRDPELGVSFGLIDKDGYEVIPIIYDSLGFMIPFDFENGSPIFHSSRNNYESFINEKHLWNYLDDFWTCNFYYGVTRYSICGKYGLINLNGDEIMQSCNESDEFAESCIDELGEISFHRPLLYDSIRKSENGLFKVSNKHYGYYNYGLINAAGIEIVECKYQILEHDINGLIKVNIGGKYCMDEDGIYEFEGGKWGFLNQDGKEQTPIEFDKIDNFENGFANAVLNYVKVKIEINGNIINQL